LNTEIGPVATARHEKGLFVMLEKLRHAWTSRGARTIAGYGAIAMVFTMLVILAATPFATSFMQQWSRADIEVRSRLIFNLTHDNLERLLAEKEGGAITTLLERIAEDERVLAVGFCNRSGVLLYSTKFMPATFSCEQVARTDTESFSTFRADGRDLIIGSFPLAVPGAGGHLVILHDLGFAEHRGTEIRRYFSAVLAIIILATVLAAAVVSVFFIRGLISRLRRTLVGARSGKFLVVPGAEHGPFEREVRQLLHQLDVNRSNIEADRTTWDASALRRLMESELAGTEVIVVSNREPYIHNRGAKDIEIQLPASGLVSALEPVMRACGGTWIAHGSGSADAEVVDIQDHIRVPPEAPSYTLRRVWMSDEEQDEYYYGLANEGLWPLCHIAFVRPIFRETDWRTYKRINERFADAVVKEAKSDTPVVLVQDYHFALLPRLIRERLPGATIVTFWHIPWPNAETFSICPWKEEIVQGLLGSSILGFHTQFHCNNFLETVDRFIESRIDREHASVTLSGHEAFVRPYPISIEWPPAALARQKAVKECRAAVYSRLRLSGDCRLAVGIERFDYTKGIQDRVRAVDSFLTQNPEWKGRFVFFQAAAPSRSKLASYRAVQDETQELTRLVNAKHGDDSWRPIILSVRHYEHDEVFELFRAADMCFVSSLHDGMNLVAKEFVAARDDERGVLVLSSFAGASRELSEALIVNPYDANGMGATIRRALTMPESEQEERMHLMRDLVRARNVYRWAGQMLLDAARLRKKQRILDLTEQNKNTARGIRGVVLGAKSARG
jgi:trehalose 6-phosphate synthase